jgi:hypothetical protein
MSDFAVSVSQGIVGVKHAGEATLRCPGTIIIFVAYLALVLGGICTVWTLGKPLTRSKRAPPDTNLIVPGSISPASIKILAFGLTKF